MRIFRQISAFFILAASGLLLWSCQKTYTEYPIEPHLDWGSYEVTKDPQKGYYVITHLNFTDGDGDIGLTDADSLPPFDTSSQYYYNLEVRYFERINGQFIQITKFYPFYEGDTINYNGRIPYLTPSSKHKGIKGDIQYDIFLGSGLVAGDAFKLQIRLYDRQLHKSNMVESPIIML